MQGRRFETAITHLTMVLDGRVVAVVAAVAFELDVVRNGDVERVVGQVLAFELAREVRIGVEVDDAAVGALLVAGRECFGGR